MSGNKIAPHQDDEMDLIIAGRKPIAALNPGTKGYNRLMGLPPEERRELFTMELTDGSVLVSREYLKLVQMHWTLYGRVHESLEDRWADVGEQFGYTTDEIEAFIQSGVGYSCTCIYCRPVGSREVV